jgi:hypothetical protein
MIDGIQALKQPMQSVFAHDCNRTFDEPQLARVDLRGHRCQTVRIQRHVPVHVGATGLLVLSVLQTDRINENQQVGRNSLLDPAALGAIGGRALFHRWRVAAQ